MLPRRTVRNRSNSNPAAPDLGGGSQTASSHDDEFAQRKTLGTLLLEMLDFFGTRFDPATTGAAWSLSRNGGVLFPLANTAPAPLVLLDPYNESRNIAYNCFKFYAVRQLFASAAAALRADTVDSGDTPMPTRLSRVIRLSRSDLK